MSGQQLQAPTNLSRWGHGISSKSTHLLTQTLHSVKCLQDQGASSILEYLRFLLFLISLPIVDWLLLSSLAVWNFLNLLQIFCSIIFLSSKERCLPLKLIKYLLSQEVSTFILYWILFNLTIIVNLELIYIYFLLNRIYFFN